MPASIETTVSRPSNSEVVQSTGMRRSAGKGPKYMYSCPSTWKASMPSEPGSHPQVAVHERARLEVEEVGRVAERVRGAVEVGRPVQERTDLHHSPDQQGHAHVAGGGSGREPGGQARSKR